MMHSMHTLLQTAFGCFSSHNSIEVHDALLQKAFKQCDLPTSLLQSTGPGDVTAVPH